MLYSAVKLALVISGSWAYLLTGYYPFFLEGTIDYLSKINNVVEKVIFEDIAVIYNLKQTTLPILKRLMWLIATSGCLIPNIDRISKSLNISRDIVYNCIEYLMQSGLISNIFEIAHGMKLIRKPGKIFINNTNLLNAINGQLNFQSDIGGIRETFFVNQVSQHHHINLHQAGDFIIDEKYIIEIGGKGKTNKQVKGLDDAFLALDGIEIGLGNKIPLYLFGLLY